MLKAESHQTRRFIIMWCPPPSKCQPSIHHIQERHKRPAHGPWS